MRSGVAFIPIAVLALSCGGSSSETPWPAEPVGPALGPAGEAASASVPADEPAAPGGGEGTAPPEEEGEAGEPAALKPAPEHRR